MPINARQYNKNKPRAVQNVNAQDDMQTPQPAVRPRNRAKYSGSKELVEMMRLANLIPKGFRFDLLQAREEGKSLEDYWLETFYGLSDDLREELVNGPEGQEYQKSLSREFWIDNESRALDSLRELSTLSEITDEEYDLIKRESADVIADFLVRKGGYGKEHSFGIFGRPFQWSIEDRKADDPLAFVQMYGAPSYTFMMTLLRIQKIRDFLHALADLALSVESHDMSHNSPHDLPGPRVDMVPQDEIQEAISGKLKDEVLASSVTIQRTGEVHFSISPWASAIQGVNISRIRRCEVCEKLFWARRRDAYACTPLHAKSRQMKRLRENWKEKGPLYLGARQKKRKRKEKS
jgi:hypothetical protein